MDLVTRFPGFWDELCEEWVRTGYNPPLPPVVEVLAVDGDIIFDRPDNVLVVEQALPDLARVIP